MLPRRSVVVRFMTGCIKSGHLAVKGRGEAELSLVWQGYTYVYKKCTLKVTSGLTERFLCLKDIEIGDPPQPNRFATSPGWGEDSRP